MSAEPDDDALLRGYLLETLPESERLELAARYFAEDELFARLEAEEADLIDEYVSGELSSEERGHFEKTLRTFPGRSDRVAFARALRNLTPESAAAAGGSAPSDLRGGITPAVWALAAALGIAMIGGIWVARQSVAYQDELASLRAEKERLVRERRGLTEELSRLRALAAASSATPGPAASLGRTVTFLLSAGLTREAAAGNRVAIPRDATIVRLQLPVPATPPAARYRVRIEGADGREVLRRERLTPTRTDGGFAVLLEVGPGALPAGDYVALLEDLSGTDPEPVEEYAFRITR